MGYSLPHVLQKSAIHDGGEVGLHARDMLQRGCWLRRIQKNMRIRTLPLGELGQTDGDLWDTGRTVAEQPIRSNPWSRGPLLRILTEANVDRVVILRNIPVDVIQAAVADLMI